MTFEEWWEQVEAYGLGLPEGYVLVPKEPTTRMVAIGRKVAQEADIWEVYKAMIQAAQEEE
jgi:hypothetical protein